MWSAADGNEVESSVAESDGWNLSVERLVQGGLIEPLIFAIFTALCLGVFLLVFRHHRFLRRLLPLRGWHLQLSPLKLNQPEIVVAYALIPPQDQSVPYFMVEEGDVRCLYIIHSLLADLYGRSQVSADSESDLRSTSHSVENLVILSGPVWNEMHELYVGLTGSPVRVDWDGTDLKLVASDGKMYCTTYVGDHRAKLCHGMIVGATVEIDGLSQRVLIVAGCSNLSTYAGARLMATIDSDRAVRTQIRKARLAWDQNWAIVFSVENWVELEGASPGPRTMQTNAVRINIERTFRAAEFSEPFEYHLPDSPTA